jgi:uncharacterized protein (TIGR03118 family)
MVKTPFRSNIGCQTLITSQRHSADNSCPLKGENPSRRWLVQPVGSGLRAGQWGINQKPNHSAPKEIFTMQSLFRRAIVLTASLSLLLISFCGSARAQAYKLVNLDSNVAGKAKHMDPLLINGWGIAYQPGNPFWVSDEGDGWSTLYNGAGVPQSLQVIVPSASGTGSGSPTGIAYNGSSQFQVNQWPAYFLFATLDGTISGWAPLANRTHAIIAVNNSGSGAVYTGVAVTSHPSGNFLYAADNANNKVDVYDGNFNFVMSFTDSTLTGMAPFGIQDINGMVYVAFAPTSGGIGGAIDIFDENGAFVKTLVKGNHLNQPWGMALAPSNFGPLSSTLIVSNNTNNGNINGYDPATGAYVGTVKNSAGKPIIINQLWGIEFGGGTANNGRTNQLFFAAGPQNNLDGTFGKISFVP